MKNITKSLIGLLGLQFILGMLASFYQEVSVDDPGSVFQHFGFILVHSLVAIVILMLSAVLLWMSFRARYQIKNAMWGLAGIVVAFITGHLFVATQNDIYSLIMAVGFLVSFGLYIYRATIDRNTAS